MADHIGHVLGNYRLIQRLGRGGFAEVYLAEHLHLKTLAAIKLLDGNLMPQDIHVFLKEAQTIAALKHPHIVRVWDFGFDAGTPFLAMEYAAHGTLRDRYPRGSLLPLSTIISYVKPIAAALDYAHQAKIIHRDIKPENILIDDAQRVLLSDFGIAALAHSTATMHTVEGSGTPYYMAPEQFQGKPCPASDQYALAVVIYEWLCGQRPFTGDSFFALGMQHVSAPVPSPRKWKSAISVPVEQVILRALTKAPKQRFESVEAFVLALEQACSIQQRDTIQTSVRNVPPPRQPSVNPAQASQSSQPQRVQNGRQGGPNSQQDFTQQCPDCTNLIFDGDDFCGSCGYHIRPRQRLLFVRNRGRYTHAQTGPCCPRCHHPIVDSSIFCGMCGIPLKYPVRSLA
jgi:serine/threonine protein kinase